MMINGIHDADISLRSGYGNAAATSFAVATAEQSSRNAAYAGKLWAEKALPLARNTVEFILLAIFPIMFIFIIVAGEFVLRIFKIYAQILMSLALWAPLAAILNYMVTKNGRAEFASALSLNNSQGFTLDNVNGLIDLALTQQAMAGQLFLVIPIIAYALVSGGAYAATSAVSSLTGGAAGSIAGTSGQLAAGNIGGGQVAWRNTNALNTSTGQVNSAFTNRSGFSQLEGAAGSLYAGNNGGAQILQGRGSTLPNISGSATQDSGTKISNTASEGSSVGQGASSTTSNQNDSASRDGNRKSFDTSKGGSTSSGVNYASGTVNQSQAAYATNTGQTAAQTNSNDVAKAIQFNAGGQVGASLGLGAKGGGGGGGGGGGAGAGLSLGGNAGVNASSTDTDRKTNALGVNAGSGINASIGATESKAATSTAQAAVTNSQSANTSRYSDASSGTASSKTNTGSATAGRSLEGSAAVASEASNKATVSTDATPQAIQKLGGAAAVFQGLNQGTLSTAAQQEAFRAVSQDAGFSAPSIGVSGVSGGQTPSSAQVSSAVLGVQGAANAQTAGAPRQAVAAQNSIKSPANTSGSSAAPQGGNAGGGQATQAGSAALSSAPPIGQGGAAQRPRLATPARPKGSNGGSNASQNYLPASIPTLDGGSVSTGAFVQGVGATQRQAQGVVSQRNLEAIRGQGDVTRDASEKVRKSPNSDTISNMLAP
jgi:TraG-like protein, N-terminal region